MKKLKPRATESGSYSSEVQSWDSNVDLSSVKAKVLSSTQHTEIMLIVLATERVNVVSKKCSF